MGFVKYSVAKVDVVRDEKDVPEWVSHALEEEQTDKSAAVLEDEEENKANTGD